jgi:TetR/AcrR family fatty acid metabolism transcriptional regulator
VRDAIQEQLAAARRGQILDAATRVFAEKGFHRATIKAIAREAGIADGTIYIYFADKTKLLIGLMDRLNETAQRESQLASGSLDDLRAFFTSYLRQRMELLWPNYQVFQAVLPELLVNAELRDLYYGQVVAPTVALAERFFEAMIAEGRVRRMDVPLTVRAIAGMLLGLLMLQMLGDAEVAARWEDLPEVVAALIFDGLEAGK